MISDRRRARGLLRRWWWLLLLAPVVAGLGARELAARYGDGGVPAYSATTMLLIGPAPESGRMNYSATTYGELLLTTSVLDPVITTLDLPFDVSTLKGRVRADPVVDPDDQSTELLSVHVVDSNPQRAAEIANAVAHSFVSYLADQTMRLTGSTRAALDMQIEKTRQQIAETQQQLQTLEQGPDSTDPSNQGQMYALRTSLNQLRQALSDHMLSAQTMDLNAAAAQLQVSIADEATAPSEPDPSAEIDPKLPATGAGLLVAVAAILGIVFFDTTVKTAAEVETLTGAPLLGAVPLVARLRATRAPLFTLMQPRSVAADAIRLIRTSLEFAASERDTAILAISSPGPDEGKSTIAVNLAVAFTQAQRSVMIIDADLRQPSLHTIFDVRNERGLSTLLARPDQPWWSAAVPTKIPRLSLIPSGPLPPNPTDLLSLDRLSRLLVEITESVDFVLFDTPPMLPVSDALEVAAKADGVILVCRANRTRRGTLEAAAARLRQGNLRLIGTILSHQPSRESRFGSKHAAANHVDLDANSRNSLLEMSPVGQADDGANGPEFVVRDEQTDVTMEGEGRQRGGSQLPAFE